MVPETGEPTADPRVERSFEHAVDEGNRRLRRPTLNILATGAVGGMDVAVGVFALLVIESQTGSRILGALGFSIGFVALVLARSELFTENFYVPIAALVAERGSGIVRVLRLWAGTLLSNWVAGCALAALIVGALPDLGPQAVEVGETYTDAGAGAAFASSVLAGFLVTLLTWMERSNDELVGKLVGAATIGFLLALGPLHHAVVALIEMTPGLVDGGASYGALEALGVSSFAIVGNMVGGIGLVTLLRLAQVGTRKVAEEQRRPSDAPDRDED